MSPLRKDTPLDAETAAALWGLRIERGLTPGERVELDTWLASDPDHADRLAAVQAAHAAVECAAAEPEIMALREAALRARPEPWRPSWRKLAAALVALAVIGGGATLGPSWIGQWGGDGVVYATGVGERATVTLADGSVLTLNTASRAVADLDGRERRVTLEAGQAYFEVAHDAARPFRVQAGDRVVTALGTAFEVRLDGERVRVALDQGSVRVEGRAGGAGRVVLAPGEVLAAGAGQPARVRPADVDQITSWRSGLVVFEDEPLARAVAEINRYATTPIVIGDAGVNRHRVSGTFRTGDSARFARTLTELFPVAIKSSDDGTITLISSGV